MFKPNPKAQVELKFRELFGRDFKTKVLGHRVSQVDCKRIGIPCGSRDGMYVTELFVDGQLVAKSNHRDWRKAYKGLVLEVEKLFADGVALV